MALMFRPEGEERPLLRMKVLQAIFIGIFVLYSLKLFSMQILSGEKYRARAQNIARRTTIIPSQRGEIFDRSFNVPMVLNIDSFAVNIIPAEIPKEAIPKIFLELSRLLNIPVSQIERKIPPEYYHLYQPIEIASNISFETIGSIAERRDELPGVGWQSKPIRNMRKQEASPT
ncbi:hypothetical protein MASR2M78_16110 [Treponema sp.]